jgi:PKD repeat protein
VPFTMTLSISRTVNTGGFTATVSPSNTTIARFVWTFGDGEGDTTTSSQTTHVYAAPGTYSVAVTATSSTGQTAASSGTIVIP